MTIYADQYRIYREEYFCLEEKDRVILREALDLLKRIYRSLDDLHDVIIITVEGVDCLAYISDDYLPIGIYNTVVPFSYDKKRTYPEQEIKQTYSFIR